MPKKRRDAGLPQEVLQTFESSVESRAGAFRHEAILTKQRLLNRVQQLLSGIDAILKAEQPASPPEGEPMDRLIEREARLRAHLEQTPRLQEILKRCGELREALTSLMALERETAQTLETPGVPTDPDILKRNILELHLCHRAQKRMVRLGIHTFGDLVRLSEKELLDGAKNFGPSSMDDTRVKLAGFGLKLRGE